MKKKATEIEINETESASIVHPIAFKFRYVFYVIGFILFLMALFSHTPQDAPLLSGAGTSNMNSYANWVGPWGAYVAQQAYLFLGLAIWPIVLICFIAIVRPFFAPPVYRHGYIPAMVLVIVGLTILYATYPENFVHDTFLYRGTESLGIGSADAPERALSGGVIGQVIAAPPVRAMGIPAGILRANIGEIGTMVTAVILALAGFIIIFICDWKVLVLHCLNSGMEKEDEDDDDEIMIQVNPPKESKIERPAIEDIVPPGIPPPPPPSEEMAIEVEDPSVYAPVPDESVRPDVRFQKPPRHAIKTENEYVSPVENVEIPLNPLVKKFESEVAPEPEEAPPTIIKPAPPAQIDSGVVVAPTRAPKTNVAPTKDGNDPYTLPLVSMLTQHIVSQKDCSELIEQHKVILCNTLNSFKIGADVTNVIVGPRVIRYELIIDQGIKMRNVEATAENLRYNLAVENIRVIAPIPGKTAVGVEVPNPKPVFVFFREILETKEWADASTQQNIPIVLGKDVNGKPYITDLARTPHLLIAGATGAGKSVCLNTLIMSMIYKFAPDELKIIMVDPKQVEMAAYKTLPHLITPVINMAEKIPIALRWAVAEMERRYTIMSQCLVKNLEGFNHRNFDPDMVDAKGNPIPRKMPYLVIIVDELADVMMTEASKDVERSVARIAQKGRAAGIHLVLATQRPSANIITGVIKTNLPTRIAFRVGSQIDSRVILDSMGAEKLLGMGDLLFLGPGGINLDRIQGACVEDKDIEAIIKFVSDQRTQHFNDEVVRDPEEEAAQEVASKAKFVDDEGDLPYDNMDPILEKYLMPGDSSDVRSSLEILIHDHKISTSYIQRCLKIGYNRAAEIMDIFEKRGIIGPSKEGGQKRDILIFDELNIKES